MSLLGCSKLLKAASLAVVTGKPKALVCAVIGRDRPASLSHLSYRLCELPFRELLISPLRAPECLVEIVAVSAGGGMRPHSLTDSLPFSIPSRIASPARSSTSAGMPTSRFHRALGVHPSGVIPSASLA